MQLFSRKKAILALSIGALSALGACGDDVTVSQPPDAPVVISITPPSGTMNIGESLSFAVQITGGSATTPPTLTGCTSSNTAVATASANASACTVTAVAAGNITVTATASTGGTAAASVTVNQQVAAITGLTVSPTTANVIAGGKVQLTPNVTKAAAAVAVAYAYQSSATAVATVSTTGEVTGVSPGSATITVTATGSGTGYTTAALTAGATINVTVAPGGISSLSVQPSSLRLAVGGAAPLVAVAAYVTGTPQPTITFQSSNTSVATLLEVNPAQNGVVTVTAVSPGTAVITVTATQAASANFGGSTVTQLVPVEVSLAANVTIHSVNQGPIATSYYEDEYFWQASNAQANAAGFTYVPESIAGIYEYANSSTNAPVDINNVRDQIQMVVNLQPNGQRVDSVVAYIADGDGSNRKAAARQIFSNGVANAEQITMYINTADFTANFAAGTADVLYTNGQKIMSVSVFTTDATGAHELGNASNNRQTVNFNNLDGYAANNINPARVAQGHPTEDNGTKRNLNWWGGPGTMGEGNATIIPVFYTPGRTLRVMEVSVIEGPNRQADLAVTPFIHDDYSLAVCGSYEFAGPANPTPSPLPYKVVYGASPTAAVSLHCTLDIGFGYEHPETNTSNFVGVVRAVDNYNNSAPRVTIQSGFRRSATVQRPIANRLDYRGPSTRDISIWRERPAVTGWVNAAFNFQSNIDVSTDRDGVGAALNSRMWSYVGCGSDTPVAMPTMSGADIPECATDFTGGWLTGQGTSRGPYRVSYTELDRLDNPANADLSGRFGVDKTVPLIRFAGGQADTARTTSASFLLTAYRAEFLDERSGFVDNNDFGAPVQNPANWTTSYVDVNIVVTNPATGAEYPQDRAQWHFLSHGAGYLPAANYPTRSQCLVPATTGANDLWRLTNPFTSGLGSFVNPAATFLSNPGCTLAPARMLQAASVGDGYRPGSPVSEPREGIYRYETRVWDRAGNASAVIFRRNGIDSSAANFASISASLGVPLGGAATFQTIAEDATEVRGVSLKLQYNNLLGHTLAQQAGLGAVVSISDQDTLVYPQVVLDARFNDNINGPVLTNVTLPMGAPTVTSIEFTDASGAIVATNNGTKMSRVGGTIWDWANRQDRQGRAGTPTFANVLGSGLADPIGFGVFTTDFPTLGFSAWKVMPTLPASHNAGAGLKAQVTATTNSINPPFARVDFYRRGSGTACVAPGDSVALATSASFNCNRNLYYLGSSTSAVSADQGTTRFWTYLAPAPAPMHWFAEQAVPAAAPLDSIVAVGVRLTGEALATQGTVLSGQAINITLAGPTLPWSVTFTGPSTITRTNADGAGQFAASVGTYATGATPIAVPTTSCTSGFALATLPASVVVAANAVTAVTVTRACMP